MKKYFLCFLPFLCATAFCGVDPAGVCIFGNATETEKFAASELILYLSKITGTQFRLVAEEQAKFRIGAEFIGDSSLGTEGFEIREKDGMTLIGSGRPDGRGILYGVYEYLQQIGCRFWTGKEEFLPEIALDRLPAVNTRQIPSFPDWRMIIADDAHSLRGKTKVNGFVSAWFLPNSKTKPEPKLGFLHDFLPSSSHTFFHFMPPEKYGQTHPEFYALRGTMRAMTRGVGQLCLTNTEMTAEFIRNVHKYLKERYRPGAFLVVSQEDNLYYCQCSACAKVDAEEGSHSGSLVQFLNILMEDLVKTYPDLQIMTTAYQYTRFPPAKTKLHPNITVKLANIECDFAQAMSNGKENEALAKQLSEWRLFASKMFLVDYGVTFDNYLLPVPNFDALALRLREAKKSGVTGVSTINAHSGGGGGEFQELRNYLTAKLYWNCELDPWAVAKEFCLGYYGKGGIHLFEYLRWYHHNLLNEKKGTFYYGMNPVHLYDERYIAKAKDFFAKAYADSGHVPEFKERIDKAYLTVLVLEIEQFARNSDFSQARMHCLDVFEKECARFKVVNLSESLKTESYLRAMRLNVPTPDFCKDIPRKDWIAHKTDAWAHHNWGKFVDDPGSVSGKPLRINTDHINWVAHKKLNILPGAGGNTNIRYDIYAHIKAEANEGANDSTLVCDAGWCDSPQVQNNPVSLKELVPGKYSYVMIAEHIAPTLTGYVWVAPRNNADLIKHVYVDHMVFVKIQTP